MVMTITVASLKETERLAAVLANMIQPPDVLTLEGDLGAGKTTFTQAFAKAIGITKTVNSPTFTIMKQYEGDYPLNHLDVYRLEGLDEDLGWNELFYGDAVSIVEWASIIQEELPTERLGIEIKCGKDNTRLFTFHPRGERFEKICEAISNDLARN